MLTSYVSQILKAEACGEIAVLPVFDKISADDTPCDVYMLIDDTDIIEFITAIPVYRRNSKIKSIIRKHLHSQMTANGKALFGFAEPAAKSRPKANKEREVPKPSVYEEPKPQVNEEEHGETDEDRVGSACFDCAWRRIGAKMKLEKILGIAIIASDCYLLYCVF